MMTVLEILDHLEKLPAEFREHYAAGRYGHAAVCFSHAVRVSGFIQMDCRVAYLNSFGWREVEEVFGRVRVNAGEQGDIKQDV